MRPRERPSSALPTHALAPQVTRAQLHTGGIASAAQPLQQQAQLAAQQQAQAAPSGAFGVRPALSATPRVSNMLRQRGAVPHGHASGQGGGGFPPTQGQSAQQQQQLLMQIGGKKITPTAPQAWASTGSQGQGTAREGYDQGYYTRDAHAYRQQQQQQQQRSVAGTPMSTLGPLAASASPCGDVQLTGRGVPLAAVNRTMLDGSAAASSATVAAASTVATPAPAASPTRASLREQLQRLHMHDASEGSARLAPSYSPQSSDRGSDDGLSDAPLPSPDPVAQRVPSAISTSRRGTEMGSSGGGGGSGGSRPASAQGSASTARFFSAAPFPPPQNAPPMPGFSGVSLEPFYAQSSSSPSPAPSSSPSPPYPSGSPSASSSPPPPLSYYPDPRESAGVGLRTVSTTQQPPALPPVSPISPSGVRIPPQELVTLHVLDESRGVAQDFRVERHLLGAGMRYFAHYLHHGAAAPHAAAPGGMPSSARPSPEEMDISVHCDIQVFAWLLRWIEWERDTGVHDEALAGTSAARSGAASSRGKLASGSKRVTSAASSRSTTAPPSFSLDSVVSLLISAEFLQMPLLIRAALGFVARNMQDIIRSPLDLACISADMVAQLVKEQFVDRMDGSVDEAREDWETTAESASSAQRRPSSSLSSSRSSASASPPLAGLSALCALQDRRGKILPRMWVHKVEMMLQARMEPGTAAVAPVMQQCLNCQRHYWIEGHGSKQQQQQQQAVAVQALPGSDSASLVDFCPSPSSKRSLSFHGHWVSPHVPTPGWTLRKHLLSLRAVARLEWEEIYWRMFGAVHQAPPDAPCEHCGATGWRYEQMRECRYHEKEAVIMRSGGSGSNGWAAPGSSPNSQQLVYPCCSAPAHPFSLAPGESAGCCVRVHRIHPRSPGALALHQMALEHVEQVCPAPPAGARDGRPASASAGGGTDRSTPPTPKKRVNIMLAHNTTQRFGAGEGTNLVQAAATTTTAGRTNSAGPSLLGPSVAAVEARFASSSASSSSHLHRSRRPLSDRRSRGRGMSDGVSDSEFESGRGSTRSSGSDDDDDDDDDDGSSDDDDDDASTDDDDETGSARRRRSTAERPRFVPGYESQNPHGHASFKKHGVQQQQQQHRGMTALPLPSAAAQSPAPLTDSSGLSLALQLKPASLAHKALCQLRDVLPESQFLALQEQLIAGQQAAAALAAAASPKPQGAQPSSIRVAARSRQLGAPVNHATKAHTPMQPQRTVKSILKTATYDATNGSQPPPSPAAAAAAALHASLASFSSLSASLETSVSGHTSASPGTFAFSDLARDRDRRPRPSSTRHSVDALIEDDRVRMAQLVHSLTQGRGVAAATNSAQQARAGGHVPGQARAQADRGGTHQSRRL